MGSRLGVLKVAAKRIGISFEDYLANLKIGLKWCTECRRWKPKDQFGRDKARGDGLSVSCSNCVIQRHTIKMVGMRARRIKRKLGLYWCRNCQDWLSEDMMVFGYNGYGSGLCREHYNQAQRDNYANNPERRRKAYQYAKERKKKVKPIVLKEKRRLLEFFEGKCAYCEERLFEEWDHFVPIEHGGKSIPSNILPACRRCNRSKHAENPYEWAAQQGLKFSVKVLQIINTSPDQVQYRHKRNPNQGGELNPTAKLTDKQAGEVRVKYSAGNYSYSSLAKEYNVGHWVISRIVRGETYSGN